MRHIPRARWTIGVIACTLTAAAVALAGPGGGGPSLSHAVPVVLRAQLATPHVGTANPGVNVPPKPAYDTNPVCVSAAKPACVALETRAIDAVRASEGVGPLYLPTNWPALTPVEQLFVLIDLERVDRGLAPFAGLTAALDRIAQQGSSPPAHPGAAIDPVLPTTYSAGPATALAINCVPSGAGYTCPSAGFPGNSNAARALSPLDSIYEWMYQDGWGGSRSTTINGDCAGPGAARCWVHRDNILGPYPTAAGFALNTLAGPARKLAAKRPTTLIMGAGDTNLGRSQANTAIFLAMIGPPPPFVYSWAQAVAAGANRP